jgi:hypothetical protein
MPTTLVQQSNLRVLIEQLRMQHDQGADMADVYKAMDALRAKDDEEQRLARTLQGTAETALLGEQPKVFVLAYRKDGETRTVSGFEHKRGRIVLEDDHGWTINSHLTVTMNELRERLDRNGIPYHIAYVEPPKKAQAGQ